jgi:hypothetical protein
MFAMAERLFPAKPLITKEGTRLFEKNVVPNYFAIVRFFPLN